MRSDHSRRLDNRRAVRSPAANSTSPSRQREVRREAQTKLEPAARYCTVAARSTSQSVGSEGHRGSSDDSSNSQIASLLSSAREHSVELHTSRQGSLVSSPPRTSAAEAIRPSPAIGSLPALAAPKKTPRRRPPPTAPPRQQISSRVWRVARRPSPVAYSSSPARGRLDWPRAVR